LNSNLAEITAAYENGWNKLTEQFYTKQEWPEAETIAPLVGDGRSFASTNLEKLILIADPVFLILYRELYYRYIRGTLVLIDIDSA
jgi:translation initiation factor 3 subunit L